MSYFPTHNGVFDYTNFTPDNIYLEDIVLGLSRINRYLGQYRKDLDFYSVAEHSLLVYETLLSQGRPANELRWGLLHDAAEAYIGDIPSPLKRLFPSLEELEETILDAIAERFGMEKGIPPFVRNVDIAIRQPEMGILYAPVGSSLTGKWTLHRGDEFSITLQNLPPSKVAHLFFDRLAYQFRPSRLTGAYNAE